MNIQPTKEHLEIIKEIGSKWVIGLATMNGALLLSIIANNAKDFNIFIGVAIILFGIGAMSALLVGWNIFLMFKKYYSGDKPKSNYYRSLLELKNDEVELKEENIVTEVEEIKDINKEDINEYNFKIILLQCTSIMSLVFGGLLFMGGMEPRYALIMIGTLGVVGCIIMWFLLAYKIFNQKIHSILYIILFIADTIFLLILGAILIIYTYENQKIILSLLGYNNFKL